MNISIRNAELTDAFALAEISKNDLGYDNEKKQIRFIKQL